MRIGTLNCGNSYQSHATENIPLFHLFSFTQKVDHVEFDGNLLMVLNQGSAVTNGMWECWGIFVIVLVTGGVFSAQCQKQ